MTDYKLSQLTTAVPAAADLIPFLDVDDFVTTPAGVAGSDKATTVANLLAGAGAPLDSANGDFLPDGVGNAGASSNAARADHVHPEKANQSMLLAPSGALAETGSRRLYQGTVTTTSGTVYFAAVGLPKGTVVANITFCTGTAPESGGTHGWYALLDSTGKVVAVSADQTGATFFGNGSLITVAMGASYTVSASGLFYVAQCVVASGMPNFIGSNLSSSIGVARAPVLCGTAGTGQTTPPAVNTTLTLTAGTIDLYGYVS